MLPDDDEVTNFVDTDDGDTTDDDDMDAVDGNDLEHNSTALNNKTKADLCIIL